jgi:hypothetical protein
MMTPQEKTTLRKIQKYEAKAEQSFISIIENGTGRRLEQIPAFVLLAWSAEARTAQAIGIRAAVLSAIVNRERVEPLARKLKCSNGHLRKVAAQARLEIWLFERKRKARK